MVNTASKLFKALCSMVVMLALVASITSIHVSAASHGIYTATAAPHYRHPNTGVIEDSGGEGSAVLGLPINNFILILRETVLTHLSLQLSCRKIMQMIQRTTASKFPVKIPLFDAPCM